MSLKKYKKIRDFSETPEPQGGKPNSPQLIFVVQKHAASHLHYDFRLEMDGVLKSWAVPKGPSLNPKIKRLAMMVEDHPFNYNTFEGVIPSGYGAGTVMVWDHGTYTINESGKLQKNKMEKQLLRDLEKGKLHLVLNGSKLKGEFALIKTKTKGENAWLLFKIADEFVSTSDVLKRDKSAASGRSLAQIKKNEKPKVAGAKAVNEIHALKKTPSSLKKPPILSPMLATLAGKVFDSEEWIYEVKWDGYRVTAQVNSGGVELWSRNKKPFTEKYYPIVNALKQQNRAMTLDGEIVVLNQAGISDFGALQNWRSEADGPLVYYIFDLTWLEGKDLCGLSVIERKTLLRQNIKLNDSIRISESFNSSATEFMKIAKDIGLEGIIAKKKDSVYLPGQRSKEWLKMKTENRQEVIIGGYTINEGTGKPFSSLLVGVYNENDLVYTGKVGTGFTEKEQKNLLKKFKKHLRKKSPFSSEPAIANPSRFRPVPPAAKVYWMKPELLAEINYAEYTKDGIMRHPVYIGLREDKDAKDVKLELVEKKKKKTALKKRKTISDEVIRPMIEKRKTLLNPTEKKQVKTVQGRSLTFKNLTKLYWPKEGISKRDVLNYYHQVAPFIIPYLSDRPQSLNRRPNGIEGKSFYQKDISDQAPEWAKTLAYRSEGDPKEKHFLVCDGEASLLYMTGLGCIEINPWHSRCSNPEHPDWCVIDLDPGTTSSFEHVITSAQVTHDVLRQLQVPSYCKTSGSTGLHIYIPLAAKYSYEESREFARLIVQLVHEQLPAITSLERLVKERKGKLYLDFLQNRSQATIAAPYSLRPKPGATVSMPLHWDEVKKGLRIQHFTIKNALARLESTGDLFGPVLGKGINLLKILKDF